MRRSAIGLVLACAFLGAAAVRAAESPPIHRLAPDGGLHRVETRLLRAFERLPLKDLAMGFGGDLLLLSPDGQLRGIAAGDSLAPAALAADLAAEHWPESLSADGTDWLLLVGGGRNLLRLGRRGEAKELLDLDLDDEALWRGLRADRAGRIWLVDPFAGDFLTLSRSGQELKRWRLPMLLPGYRGPVRGWCPDEQGGLYLAEGEPLRIHRLNATGNLLGSWNIDLDAEGGVALAADAKGTLLLALAREGDAPQLALRDATEAIALAHGGRLWILAAEDDSSEAP